ncbi:hypothetical protein FIBSPDRAFT_868892, partial [Athelia psychrophila]
MRKHFWNKLREPVRYKCRCLLETDFQGSSSSLVSLASQFLPSCLPPHLPLASARSLLYLDETSEPANAFLGSQH